MMARHLRIVRDEPPRKKRPRAHHQTDALTPEQQARVRLALRAQCRRFGSMRALATALGVSVTTLSHAVGKRPISSALAVRLASVASVDLTALLRPGPAVAECCPTCGRAMP